MAKAPTAAKTVTASNVPNENKTTETPEAPKVPPRINIRFFGADAKENFAAPPVGCSGIGMIHTPDKSFKNGHIPVEKWALKNADLDANKGLERQLAFFGASVLLRNCINTEKDEEAARKTLVERLTGFKNGIYRATSVASESVPTVVRAYQNALRAAGNYTEEEIAKKVDEKLEAWKNADRKGKAELRGKLMSVKVVQAEYNKLVTVKEEENEKAPELADL